jgi:beta-phosphoglucomutase-like phosphatase (HAD superfamily)
MNWLDGIKVVLFDMDGTLISLGIDNEEMRRQIRNLFLSECNIHKEFKPILKEIETTIDTLKNEGITPRESQKLRSMALEIVAREEVRAVGSSKLLPYAEELLNFLKKRKIKMGLISRNGRWCVYLALTKWCVYQSYSSFNQKVYRELRE